MDPDPSQSPRHVALLVSPAPSTGKRDRIDVAESDSGGRRGLTQSSRHLPEGRVRASRDRIASTGEPDTPALEGAQDGGARSSASGVDGGKDHEVILPGSRRWSIVATHAGTHLLGPDSIANDTTRWITESGQMTRSTPQTAQSDFAGEVTRRLQHLQDHVASGGLDEAIGLLTTCVRNNGVIQAFGTGHSEGFSMEVAGRAGGLIPTRRITLREVVIVGDRDREELFRPELERDPTVVEELLAHTEIHPEDVFVIASNSGVNSSIVGMALALKERGHNVIAVTSLEHTNAVEPKHASGKRLSEIADVVIDNLAPFGDATLELDHGIKVGAVSSLTAAFIAQALTLGVVGRILDAGEVPPVFLSANIPGGDEHNRVLQDRYGLRIRSF